MKNKRFQNIKGPQSMEIGGVSGEDSVEVIVKYSGSILGLEEELGAEAEDLGENFAIVTLQRSRIPLLYGYKEIIYTELPKTLTLSMVRNLRNSCVSEVHSREEYGLTGKGVIVGVIDSGIDYTHPDFREPEGGSRILFLWDQTEAGNPPMGFKRGAEYDNSRINAALQSAQPLDTVPSTDYVGHGTAVAGIAAGNGNAGGGREKGVAPEAKLIIVKLGYRGYESFARTTEIMRALKYIADKAEALGMPAAINLSFGTNNGSHSGDTLFEAYINALAQRWKLAVVAASGNEGAAGHHFFGRIGPGQTMDVSFAVAERISSVYLTFWKSFVDSFTLELILPSGNSTGTLDPSQRLITKSIDGISIQVYYGQPTHYNEDQEIFFQIPPQGSSVPQGLWRLRVKGDEVVRGGFDVWLPTVEEVGRNTAFSEPSADTTLTLPSTAANVISVGGYNDAIGAAAMFSGRGFTRNNADIKPDLVAPAVDILAARSGGGYDAFTGTSMAAPFVTGASALMMQWGIVSGNDPFLYGQRVKAFLKKGAERSASIEYPNQIWGYGTLCLKATMDYLIYG